jgi:hypothetical protein
VTLDAFPEEPGYIQVIRCPENACRTVPYNIGLIQNTIKPGPRFVPMQAVRIDSIT